ncbi:MAG: 30S ribosomal protein S11 [Patescibacteria group bacterium]
MGKKRTVVKKGGGFDSELRARSLGKTVRRKVSSGTLYIRSSYNNTGVLLTDKDGNTLCWASSGSLGFKGTKKGTPFAAAKVGELVGEKAKGIGVAEVNVILKGVGPGRESSLRAFASKGIELSSIEDATPIPHNGPRAPRPRRV